jgi:hypothetical protein
MSLGSNSKEADPVGLASFVFVNFAFAFARVAPAFRLAAFSCARSQFKPNPCQPEGWRYIVLRSGDLHVAIFSVAFGLLLFTVFPVTLLFRNESKKSYAGVTQSLRPLNPRRSS